MVFNDGLIIGVLILLILGFCALTYIVIKLQTHYNRLTHGVSSSTLTQVMNELLGEFGKLKSRTSQVEKSTERIET